MNQNKSSKSRNDEVVKEKSSNRENAPYRKVNKSKIRQALTLIFQNQKMAKEKKLK